MDFRRRRHPSRGEPERVSADTSQSSGIEPRTATGEFGEKWQSRAARVDLFPYEVKTTNEPSDIVFDFPAKLRKEVCAMSTTTLTKIESLINDRGQRESCD